MDQLPLSWRYRKFVFVSTDVRYAPLETGRGGFPEADRAPKKGAVEFVHNLSNESQGFAL